MCWDEKFHAIMEKICSKFGIAFDRKYKDESGKEYNFHGSPEVKGIKAGDGRKYVMDLMRMSPRDANYKDAQDFECCTLRNELVRNYLFFVNLQKQYQDHQKKVLENQKKEEEKKELEKIEGEKSEKKVSTEEFKVMEKEQKKEEIKEIKEKKEAFK